MMTSIILALSLSQATFAPGQENALQQAFTDAVTWVRQGNAPQHSRPTEAHGGQPLAVDGFAVRCTGYFAEGDLAFWTFAPANYQTGEPPSSPSWLRYAVVTVAASSPRTDPPTATWDGQVVSGTCSGPLPAAAGSYPVTITLFNDPASQATTTGWTTGCYPGTGTCEYRPTGIDGQLLPPVPCPKGLAMAPGSFTGSVLYLPAVAIAGAPAWPPACD